ncbi:tRNA (adenine(58)-N(1))-methyltransferase non-catalytic subunit trm6 [Malassezia psittaci]|uniref:tRNA (adenine(58)-N(1))-methyltransferase non-catalytic subunit TRM6 n=1 Tax=Malassezia psittaci TaxID=1821823 RepID=A0AAF0JEP0_9BASI|nr:tRNA (adenine(58)-N(1))-methyltransferase non-catalytic subunit trm6 [Malassezia psittaci]
MPDAKRARTEDVSVLDNAHLRHRVMFVPANQPVLLRLPSGMTKQVVLESGKLVSIGKFGSFHADEVVGKPFGPTYEIKSDGHLEIMQQDVAEALVETEATNENIFDDGESQTLSYEDIKALKDAGASGREIIQKQLEGNKSYELRTAYSQDKIMKRKESKHLKFFTPIPPSLNNVAWYNFERHPDKIRYLRPDSLSQMLSFANVQSGGKYVIVDGVGGLLTGAVLERMAGKSTVLTQEVDLYT